MQALRTPQIQCHNVYRQSTIRGLQQGHLLVTAMFAEIGEYVLTSCSTTTGSQHHHVCPLGGDGASEEAFAAT